ncbi:BC85_0335 family putative methyltransferase [Mycoplasma tauri]|uniref:Uncharacterized protein n=1 Tax=Mycoplasma tauri TaxID=547987 RepID=A0A953NGP1_9MOLU|nr:hypothetical protein [Mycoplasma tauri]MBZ4195550.1 hypothetical protein [Mycoplasma tauri]MBZ4212463.1 hypothetical protein [Mycoplasma tauri]MBZ4218110.1 hypothetical protein [Mycoplasma tauri]QSB07801.1 hypothetical protein JS510_01610 [Mycoplasma tauri]
MNFKEKIFYNGWPTSLGWGLIASVIIVSLISTIVAVVTFVKIIKMKRQIDKDYHKKSEEAIIAIKGSPLDAKPEFINKAFTNTIHELDTMQMVKSVYLNNAKDVLVDGKELENLYLSLKFLTLANIEIYHKAIDIKKWNEAVLNYPNDLKEQPNFISNENKKYKLIFSANDDSSNMEIFGKLFNKLEPNGMIMIIQNDNLKKDLKTIKYELKLKNIRFEVSKNKEKILYAVKSGEEIDKKNISNI